MKRWTQAVLVGALVAMTPLFMPVIHAHDNDGDEQAEHHKGMEGKGLEKLGLTPDQVTKVKDAMKAMHESMESSHDQLKKDMDTLRNQVKNKASDADIQKTLDQVEQDHKGMQSAMQAAHDKFKADTAFLTSTQRAKMFLGAMKRMHEHGGWFGHGDHHMGKAKKDGDKDAPHEDEGQEETGD